MLRDHPLFARLATVLGLALVTAGIFLVVSVVGPFFLVGPFIGYDNFLQARYAVILVVGLVSSGVGWMLATRARDSLDDLWRAPVPESDEVDV